MARDIRQTPFEWIAELGLAVPRPNDDMEQKVRSIRERASSSLLEYPRTIEEMQPTMTPPERSTVVTPPPPYRSPSPSITRTRSDSYHPPSNIPAISESSSAPVSPPPRPAIPVRRKPIPPPSPPPKMLGRSPSMSSDSYKEVVFEPMSDVDTFKEVVPPVPTRSVRRPPSQPDSSMPIQVSPSLEHAPNFLSKEEERIRHGLIPREISEPPYLKTEDDDIIPQPSSEQEPTSFLELTRRRNQRRSTQTGSSQRRASIQSQSTTSLPSPSIGSPVEPFSAEDPSSFMMIREREQKKMTREQTQYPSPPSSAPPSVRVDSPSPKVPSPQSSVSKPNPYASNYPPPAASVSNIDLPASKHEPAAPSEPDSYLAMIRQRNRRRQGGPVPGQG